MINNPETKYIRPDPIALSDRTWPENAIVAAPTWMSTDLRDGNQSLVNPMSAEKKLTFFKALVEMGFKEIEVGFPSASETDFSFVRTLIEAGHIPDDVTIEVITQARKELIERTVESLQGAKSAILHVYNPTAPQFRKIVYKASKEEIKGIAVTATRWCKELTAQYPETKWTYQYSPETFSATELVFSKEVCDAVIAAWGPTPENRVIINLPTTVEGNTPNVFADQIEWMDRNISQRDSVVLSVHPHNDRGTAVASAELALMAGADRVEGCLFGNGERTGNVDLVTLALNMYVHGVDPQLDFSDIDKIKKLVEESNEIPVHPRHPYAGELVFTAFSGSHQDAIKKGLAVQKEDTPWEVPYLPIDPRDLNRNYDAVIRVNSQSGKGGVAYILEQETGFEIPRKLQIAFSRVVQEVSDATGVEVERSRISEIFHNAYMNDSDPYQFLSMNYQDCGDGVSAVLNLQSVKDNNSFSLSGQGKGPLDAVVDAIRHFTGLDIFVSDYHEHALSEGASVSAVSFVELRIESRTVQWGVGVDDSIVHSAIKAVLSGVNQYGLR